MIESSRDPRPAGINGRVALFCACFFALFCAVALLDGDTLAQIVDSSFAWSARYFGLYWQLLLFGTFFAGLFVALLPGGKARLGGLTVPEFTDFQWVSMVMCTLLAGGGVFWAAGEPMAHFLDLPPAFASVDAGTEAAVPFALAQSYLHWGFLAWAILGSLTTIMLMHYHYDEGLPLAPRTLLYPVFRERAVKGLIGDLADAACMVAVVAGTVGPIGFLGLQVSYGLHALFGTPDTFATQTWVIVGLVALYLASAISGIGRGIQLLSRANMILGGALLLFVLLAGPTLFTMRAFGMGLSTHVQHFFEIALFRGDASFFGKPGWLAYWTVFFWGWFIGYGPLMAIFIARISRGRSIRAIVMMLSVFAPLITMAWFTILGGTGLGIELAQPGSVSTAMEGFNLPAALLAITQALPQGFLVSLLFLILTTIFVATTGDSMTYALAVSLSRSEHPPTLLRVFWGGAMGAIALTLVGLGSGGIDKLQSFIVVTAVPVSLILLPSLWDAVRITLARAAVSGASVPSQSPGSHRTGTPTGVDRRRPEP